MPFGCSCLLSCNWSAARHRVCHFVLISFWAIHPKTATRRPCLTPATWVQLQRNTTHIHTHMHTGNHRLPNLSKFILCWTDTRTSVGVHFHRRCDLNCLSLKLSLIVLTVLPYSNGQGWLGSCGAIVTAGNRAVKGHVVRVQLSPHTQTHVNIG